MERACPICDRRHEGSDAIGAFPPTHFQQFSEATFSLIDCPDCGLIYISPAPTPEDLDLLYVKSEQFTEETYTDEARAALTVAYMKEIYAHGVRISESAGRAGARRVVEIGSGLAWMCRAAKESDDDVVTVAQDVTAEVAEQCPWVDYYVVGGVEDARLELLGPYDIASMTHVIEHLLDPISVLKRVHALLGPKGALFLSAPYRPIGWRRGDGPALWESFDYHHIPAHTQYFNEASLARAAERAGFKLIAFNAGHEDGKAFDAFLVKDDA